MSDTAPDPQVVTDSSSDWDDLDCAIAGGWSPRVWDCIHWLRANGCSDCAVRLEMAAENAYRRELQTQSEPPAAPLEARWSAMGALRDELALLLSNRPARLTPQQREEWGALLRRAIRSVMGEPELPAEAGERTEQAAKNIATPPAPDASAQAPGGSEQKDEPRADDTAGCGLEFNSIRRAGAMWNVRYGAEQIPFPMKALSKPC